MESSKIKEQELKNYIVNQWHQMGFVMVGNQIATQTPESARNVISWIKNKNLESKKIYIERAYSAILDHSITASQLCPEKIKPRIIDCNKSEYFGNLFLGWRNLWWSMTYSGAVGRRLPILMWDDYHNAPIGLWGLASHRYSKGGNGINKYANNSLECRSGGALPPYSFLLGGKLTTALSLTDDVKNIFKQTYGDDLYFTITSAMYGKSPIYDRITINGIKMSHQYGYDSGSSEIHIMHFRDKLVKWGEENLNPKTYYPKGSAIYPKEMARIVLKHLGFKKPYYHGIVKPRYLHTTCLNIKDVLQHGSNPKMTKLSTETAFKWWYERWFKPRSKTLLSNPDYLNYDVENELKTIFDKPIHRHLSLF